MKIFALPSLLLAATTLAQEDQLLGPGDVPKLQNATIPGAPLLGQPFLVMGKTRPVMGEFHGLAAPALFDWDEDGRRDLLIGEFETRPDGCFVRVYNNVGTDEAPRFTDEFVYAKTLDDKRMKIESW